MADIATVTQITGTNVFAEVRSALPVNLILPAGAHGGQSINFIKKDDRRPHQVGLQAQKYVQTLSKNSQVQLTGGVKQSNVITEVSPDQRASVAAVQIHPPTC